MGIVWTIVIGLLFGITAKFVMPGYRQVPGFRLTTMLGVLGAVMASFLGLVLGWFSPGQGGGILAAAFGAMAALAGWDHAQKSA